MKRKQFRRNMTKHNCGYSLTERKQLMKIYHGYSQRERMTHENFSVYTETQQLKFGFSPMKKSENKTV